MGYTKAGILLPQVSPAELKKLLPEAKAILEIPGTDFLAVDFADPDSDRYRPLSRSLNKFHMSDEVSQLYPSLSALNETLGKKNFGKMGIHGEMNLALPLSGELACRCISFVTDDDEADCIAVCEKGRLVFLREYRRYIDVQYSESALTFIPLFSDEFDDPDEIDSMHATAKVLASGTSTMFAGVEEIEPALHRVVATYLKNFGLTAPELIGVGTFDDSSLESFQRL